MAHFRLTAATAALVALAVATPALGQVDEIIVTARKRDENLREIPVSIEAITAEDIQRQGLTDLSRIAQQSASIKFDQGSSRNDTRLSIRGLSPTRGRQNAAILVDGIDISSEAISTSGGSVLVNQRLLAIERTEIVKGPQSALWGRSAFNGAVNFVTKDPYDTWGGNLNLDANDYDQYGFSADVGGPVLGEKLGILVNGSWWDEEGFHENSITGNEIGGESGYGFSVKAKSQLTEGLTLEARASWEHYEYEQSPEAFLGANTTLQQPAGAFIINNDPELATPASALFCLPEVLDLITPGSAVSQQLLNQTLIDRYIRLSQDPNNPAIGDSPHCQRQVPVYVGKVPDGDDLRVRLSTDPFNPGQDYEGLEGDTLRLTLSAAWELEYGSFTFNTGYTDDDGKESVDFARYAVDLPDEPFLDDNVNLFQSNNRKELTQFQYDLRYTTNLDGPVNMTLGGTFWKEDVKNRARSLTNQSNGSYCFYSTNNLADIDAANFIFQPACPGYTEVPIQYFIGDLSGVAPAQAQFGNGTPYRGIQDLTRDSPADRFTEHRSIYGLIEIDVTESTTFTFEGRYSHEDLRVVGPTFWRTTATGGPGSWSICGVPGLPCSGESFGLGALEWLRRAPGTISANDLGGPFWSEGNFRRQYDVWEGITDAGVKNTNLFQVYDPIVSPNGVLNPECASDASLLAAEAAVDAEIAAAQQEGRLAVDPQFDLLNPYCNKTLQRTDDWFAPKLTLSHKFGTDTLIYGSWAHSEKPGGFATFTFGASGVREDLAAFKPEKMDTWEVGSKTSLFDGTLYFEGALFYNDYTDKQVLVQGLGPDGRAVSKIDNAPAQIFGAELSVAWNPLDTFLGGDWDVKASYLYVDGEYGNYVDNATSENNIALAGNCIPSVLEETIIVNDPLTGESQSFVLSRAACEVSFEGNKLERAPKHTVVTSTRYSVPFGESMTGSVELDAQWKSKQYIEYTNESWLGSYWNFDLLLGLEGQSWNVTGYIENLLDDDSIRSASNQPGLGCCFALGVSADIGGLLGGLGSTAEVPNARAAFLTQPRTFGIRAAYKFGNND